MAGFLQLFRWKNLLIIGFTQITLIQLFELPFDLKAVALIISTILCAAAGYVINDCYDREADKINKPDRVFVGDIITYSQARRLYFVLVCVSLWIGYYAFRDNVSFLLTIHIGLFLYSYKLKRWPIIGNVIVSLFSAAVIYSFLLADFASFSDYYSWFVVSFSSFAFLLSWIREMVKDLEDKTGDEKLDYKTLAVITTPFVSKVLSVCISILILAGLLYIGLYYFPMVVSISGIVLLVVEVGLFGFLVPFKILKAKSKKNYKELSMLLKLVMLLVLIILQIALFF